MSIQGLHHVTAIAGDPQRNLDFYTGALGLRLVKKTVNFDDPGTYHFYFGDAAGSPGTILTFFPWPHARPGARGSGETESTAFTIPEASLGYWSHRLKSHGVSVDRADTRFGEDVLRFSDPDGMLLELVGSRPPADVDPWTNGPVPDEHAIRAFHGVSLAVGSIEDTANLLAGHFGYRRAEEAGARTRFVSADSSAPGAVVDLLHVPSLPRGRLGAGTVHHVAFRSPDETAQAGLRARLDEAGFDVSPVMERVYFRSVYFREPSGVLFELATDGPGFSADEPQETLGSRLQLPPWLEASRDRVEAVLPAISQSAVVPS